MDPGNPSVAITYKDDGNQDGICSQLLRIYGAYAISRFLGIPYFHSPIAHLGYHGLAALERNSPLPDLLADVNRVFHIPSEIELPGRQVTVHDMVDADLESITKIKNAASNNSGLHLIRILYPFPITDNNPELYRCLQKVCPFPYRRSEVFRLAIHVRRGELFAVSSDWMLPNSYYVSCVLRFQDVLRKLGIPFVCELYTEVPTKVFEVTPDHHGINSRIAQSITFDPVMNHLEDFDSIPNLERFVNFDTIESLRRMSTADALIISHSSFSYLPAIFNPNCIVVYHPYWRGRMKDWLVSDDNGIFPESYLIERLKSWKSSRVNHSAAQNLSPDLERLLQPFKRQSAAIRSVTGLEMPEEFSQRARMMSGSSLGDDLLLLPVGALNKVISAAAEEFRFRAVAVLFSEASGWPADEENWKIRRSFFDRGLICIGSVAFAGYQALCFLASDAIRSFNQLDVESRGHITMSTLVEGAGFANQLWRYACVKLFALRHALTPAFPPWQGNQLFGLEDKACSGFNFPVIAYPGFANNDRELWDREDPPINIDLSGYFQEIPESWRKHRAFLRHMFQLSPAHVQAIDAWKDAVTDGGLRTLVAISIRRGDYHNFQIESLPWFRIVPETWYLDWLRTIWPTLRDPVLYVASDEPDKSLPLFQEFEPVPATFGSIAEQLPHHIKDFEVLRRADYMAICNSSFPRFAAILAPSEQKCFLPSFETQCFEPYQPWMDPAFWPRFAHTWSRAHLSIEQEQPALFFEISDLLLSLPPRTRLSGTQRLEWEILCSLLDSTPSMTVSFVVAAKEGDLGSVETEALRDVIERLRTGVASSAGIESEARALLDRAVPCAVRQGDIFLTAGEFWNVTGIGASLRNMKNSGAMIGFFIHDLFAIVAPEFVEPTVARASAKGILESLPLADFILTPSQHSKASLTRYLGSALDSVPVHVVPLGHELRLASSVEPGISAAVARILEQDYVLCACTIEARNNPAYLFNIWKMMLRSGRLNIPRLVFAGRKGWLAEDFIRQLEACNDLHGRILLLPDITDAELDALYRNCILTAFPSFVEGSAQPVGESLARRKICICSGEGANQEVGGQFADYVDPYNVRDGLQRLLWYLDHPEQRRGRELEIAGHFKPRSWRQTSDDVLASARMLARQIRQSEGVVAVTLPSNRYVPVGSGAPGIAMDVCVSGWRPPETSGIRPSRPTATLRFRTNAPVGTGVNLVLNLEAFGRDFRIRINSGSGAEADVSLADGSNRVAVLVTTVEPGKLLTANILTIGAKPVEDESPDGPYWMLKGILYFDPKAPLQATRHRNQLLRQQGS